MIRPGIPILQLQLTAAKHLYDALKQWRAANDALVALAQRFPDFGIESTLLKVAAVNQLYGTNVYAVVRMAEHVSHVMTTKAEALADELLVERIAALPPAVEQPHERRHTSFASKFSHFFVDTERFPIYDSYAVKMVEYHLSTTERIHDAQHPYRAFVQNLLRLKQRDHITCTNQDLDAYLWLAGLYWEKRRSTKAQINTEVARLLEAPPPHVTKALAALLPTDLEETLSTNLTSVRSRRTS
jgi:hypothetical protein